MLPASVAWEGYFRFQQWKATIANLSVSLVTCLFPYSKLPATLAAFRTCAFSTSKYTQMKHLLKASLGALLLVLAIGMHAQQVARTGSNVANRGTDAAGSNRGQAGAYAMLMQIVSDGTRDSMLNVQQFKIYTDRHFMYAHALPGDSLAYYGIGTYRNEDGRLMEYPFFTSEGGARNDTVEIRITKLGNGYVQVINFPPDSQGKEYILTEEYGNVSTPVTSPLDGAWKQTKTQFVPKTGIATASNNGTQFKVFQSGHFMWARTDTDSATGKPVSTFGYGTFEMQGPNRFRERTTNSTFRTALIGKPVLVHLKFTGSDTLQQTIDWPDGRSVETYQRLE